MKHDEYPVKEFKTAKAYETWLLKNHAKEDGVWLKMAKAKSGIKTITYSEAVEVSLCFGWIDGMSKGLDEIYFTQKFTPRRPNSKWSVINKGKVADLIKQGRMQPPGLAAIEEAKKNGQWDNAYLSSSKITVPDDLQEALDKNKKAKDFFSKLSSQNRYAILYRLQQVKREETKKKKIEQFVAMLERHETIYPQ
ncbi:MAG: YdeI/OmpD-associated family protein [Chitinophagaceae bacterium]|nr:YdeI/OmpD-associated family protein [Chitinophagaceae bacterium]